MCPDTGAAGTFGCYWLSARLWPRLYPAHEQLSSADKRDWNSRGAHIVHALVVTAMVMAALVACPDFAAAGAHLGRPHAATLTAATGLSTATFALSLGYFVADTLLMWCLHTQAPGVMLAHHVAGAAALVTVLVNAQCHFYGLLLLSTEMTTPFINSRWLLDKAEQRRSTLYLLNGVCIFVGWVLSRILLFFYLFWHMWAHRDVMATLSGSIQVVAPSITVGLFVLNLFWFGRICRGIARLVGGKFKLT